MSVKVNLVKKSAIVSDSTRNSQVKDRSIHNDLNHHYQTVELFSEMLIRENENQVPDGWYVAAGGAA